MTWRGDQLGLLRQQTGFFRSPSTIWHLGIRSVLLSSGSMACPDHGRTRRQQFPARVRQYPCDRNCLLSVRLRVRAVCRFYGNRPRHSIQNAGFGGCGSGCGTGHFLPRGRVSGLSAVSRCDEGGATVEWGGVSRDACRYRYAGAGPLIAGFAGTRG